MKTNILLSAIVSSALMAGTHLSAAEANGSETIKPAAMETTSTMKQQVFGNMPDGREVKIFTLTNSNGLTARVTEYGAILVSMETPDKAGKTGDITHGYDTLEGWLTNTSYLGSTVGRFGNRIKDGKFKFLETIAP